MMEFSDVIYELYQKNSLSDVLGYYEHHDGLLRRSGNVIRTIGVFYFRIYDGGIERVLSNLLYLWSKMGYKVIFFSEEEPNSKDYDYPKEIQRVIIPPIADMCKRLHKLENEICVRKVDIFIHNAWGYETVLWEMLLIKLHHIPFVVYTHGHFTAMYESASEYAMMSHRVFALCDKVIALSDANARFYELCGCSVARLENPISKQHREIQPAPCNAQNHRILWIGRIAAGKRIEDALRIFAEVKKKVPDSKLDIVGSGSETDESHARMLSEELRLEDSVKFHGYQIEVGKYYRDSAVMLMTSEKEGYSYILLESKAYGKPCVMYSLPYLSLVKDGKGMRSAKIGDIDAMAEQLCEILLNESLRQDLEREARESFDALCQYDYTLKWKEVFEELEKPADGGSDDLQGGFMISTLLSALHEGADRRIENSFEYQIGTKTLRIRRAIRLFLGLDKRKG